MTSKWTTALPIALLSAPDRRRPQTRRYRRTVTAAGSSRQLIRFSPKSAGRATSGRARRRSGWLLPPRRRGVDPRSIGGATSRTLLVVDDPDAVVRQAVAAGATEISRVSDEPGWRLGRIADPFGQECEIGTPLGRWPP